MNTIEIINRKNVKFFHLAHSHNWANPIDWEIKPIVGNIVLAVLRDGRRFVAQHYRCADGTTFHRIERTEITQFQRFDNAFWGEGRFLPCSKEEALVCLDHLLKADGVDRTASVMSFLGLED